MARESDTENKRGWRFGLLALVTAVALVASACGSDEQAAPAATTAAPAATTAAPATTAAVVAAEAAIPAPLLTKPAVFDGGFCTAVGF